MVSPQVAILVGPTHPKYQAILDLVGAEPTSAAQELMVSPRHAWVNYPFAEEDVKPFIIPERRQRTNGQRVARWKVNHMIEWPLFQAVAAYLTGYHKERVYAVETEYYVGFWVRHNHKKDELFAAVAPRPKWNPGRYSRSTHGLGAYEIPPTGNLGLVVYLPQLTDKEWDPQSTWVSDAVGVSFPGKVRFHITEQDQARARRSLVLESFRSAMREPTDDGKL